MSPEGTGRARYLSPPKMLCDLVNFAREEKNVSQVSDIFNEDVMNIPLAANFILQSGKPGKDNKHSKSLISSQSLTLTLVEIRDNGKGKTIRNRAQKRTKFILLSVTLIPTFYPSMNSLYSRHLPS